MPTTIKLETLTIIREKCLKAGWWRALEELLKGQLGDHFLEDGATSKVVHVDSIRAEQVEDVVLYKSAVVLPTYHLKISMIGSKYT